MMSHVLNLIYLGHCHYFPQRLEYNGIFSVLLLVSPLRIQGNSKSLFKAGFLCMDPERLQLKYRNIVRLLCMFYY